jgi:pathogenesis-related protein 1
MKRVLLPLVVVFTLVLVGAVTAQKKPAKQPVTKTASIAVVPSKCIGNGLTQAEQTEILVAHNRIRASVGLAPLRWDCGIATTAQAWAAKAVAGHNEYTPYGENIFVAMDGAEKVSTATDRWDSEKADWTNKPGTCAPGKTCTHYTQMVWRSATKIGCGVNRSGPDKWKTILVCNYDVEARTGPAF